MSHEHLSLARDMLRVSDPPGATEISKRQHRAARLRLKAYAVKVLDALEASVLGDDNVVPFDDHR